MDTDHGETGVVLTIMAVLSSHLQMKIPPDCRADAAPSCASTRQLNQKQLPFPNPDFFADLSQ